MGHQKSRLMKYPQMRVEKRKLKIHILYTQNNCRDVTINHNSKYCTQRGHNLMTDKKGNA